MAPERGPVRCRGMHLQTRRLQLRPIEMTDIDEVAALLGNPEVSRYLGDGRPRPRERVELGLRNGRRMWDERGFGPFYAAGESGFVGVGLLMPIARTGIATTDLDARGPEIEIGYWIARSAWGVGFATEIGSAVLDWAMGPDGPGLDRVIAVTHPDNAASQRVLEKIGMARVGETDAYYGSTTVLYEYGPA